MSNNARERSLAGWRKIDEAEPIELDATAADTWPLATSTSRRRNAAHAFRFVDAGSCGSPARLPTRERIDTTRHGQLPRTATVTLRPDRPRLRGKFAANGLEDRSTAEANGL